MNRTRQTTSRQTTKRTIVLPLSILILFLASVVLLANAAPTVAAAVDAVTIEPIMPAYDERRRLLLPEDYETWIFVGSSLGLSYSEGSSGMEMFHHTLMEPTAYQHFRQTGEFREGTMLALLLHSTGNGVLPARSGRFAAEIGAVEMAVKDSSRVDETWAYYNFGVPRGQRPAVQPLPAQACQSCHVEHAGHDNVFVQFYPLLVDAAPEGALPASLTRALPSRNGVPSAQQAQGEASDSEEGGAVLALAGLDPIHLIAGREEPGKPEIVMEFDGFRYQFVSEPSRQTFAADPARYSIQNDTCPVVPGAPINPTLIAVHEEKIYAFASPACVGQFNADPESFVENL